jgi:hypothetical protein
MLPPSSGLKCMVNGKWGEYKEGMGKMGYSVSRYSAWEEIVLNRA